MIFNYKISLLWFILLSLSFTVTANNDDTPCSGSNNLLALVDRPSYGDSACVVPQHNSLLESGYQYQSLLGGGNLQNVAETVYRYGLADQFEIVMTFPAYIHQNITPKAGFTAGSVGVKHQLSANQKWVTTIEGLLTLPSGSSSFGSKEPGGAVNGIISYDITPAIGITGMFGISSQSEPAYSGGQSYTSFNPYLVLSWTKDRAVFFIEVYGQSSTGPQQGSGFNMDGGVLYLVKKNITVDLEVGQRLSGSLFDFNQYIGTGVAILFG